MQVDEKHMTFDEWKGKVNELFVGHVCCDWSDLCGDWEPLTAAFDADESPEEFVKRYIDKYGLECMSRV